MRVFQAISPKDVTATQLVVEDFPETLGKEEDSLGAQSTALAPRVAEERSTAVVGPVKGEALAGVEEATKAAMEHQNFPSPLTTPLVEPPGYTRTTGKPARDRYKTVQDSTLGKPC